MQTENRIRNWLMTFPGLITGSSPQRVLQQAWGVSGIECSLGDFTDAMWRAGYRPEQVGTRWHLALPDRPNR